jgi:hypothetical protein
MPAIIQRNAQGLALGLGRSTGAAAFSLTGTLQIPALLQDLVLRASQLGLVTDLRVAGQVLMCSNQGATLDMFRPDAEVEGQRGLGIPLAAQQVVQCDGTLAAAGTIAGGIGVDPITPDRVVPVNMLGRALDYVFGLGSSGAVAAGAAGTLTATSRRDVMLGRIVMNSDGGGDVVTVRSIQVNNIELLSGQSGATDELPVEYFSGENSDVDGLTLAYPVQDNGNVTVTIQNNDAVARTTYGGIFVMPEVAAEAA